MKKTGAYLPGAHEEVVELVDAYVLTEKVCTVFCMSVLCMYGRNILPPGL